MWINLARTVLAYFIHSLCTNSFLFMYNKKIMLRKNPFIKGEYYHIYNRGIDKRTIFESKEDYKRFIMLLHLSNSINVIRLDNLILCNRRSFKEVMTIDTEAPIVSIGAWCLMPNHFHILIKEDEEGGITKFMRKLCTGYSMYFNRKYNRQGSLLGGVFKSRLIGNDDNYMKYLFSYIHLNPLDISFSGWEYNNNVSNKEIKNILDTYEYSSYLDCLKVPRLENNIINHKNFPDYFENSKSFRDFVENFFINRPSKDGPC